MGRKHRRNTAEAPAIMGEVMPDLGAVARDIRESYAAAVVPNEVLGADALVTALEEQDTVAVTYPAEAQLARLAAATLLSVRTVRRWYAFPERTEITNRGRLRRAATRLGIEQPRHPANPR